MDKFLKLSSEDFQDKCLEFTRKKNSLRCLLKKRKSLESSGEISEVQEKIAWDIFGGILGEKPREISEGISHKMSAKVPAEVAEKDTERTFQVIPQ